MKYYLRGIGIGIVITTIILTIAFRQEQQQSLTDEQVIQRAKQLGMVEGNSASADASYKTIADLMDEANQNSQSENSDSNDQGTQTDENTDQQNTDQQNTDQQSTDQQNTDQQNTDQQKTTPKTVQIKVKGGDSSNTIAQKCEDAGLVKDANTFNQYLINQGYDSILQPGTYKIQIGSTKKQIAKILTKH